MVSTTKPGESAIYSENFLNNTIITVAEDNSATDLNCNIWNADYAVDITNGTTNSPTLLSMGWGTLGESSGNKRANTNNLPLMQAYQLNYPYNNGKFPHYTTSASLEQFSYFNKIQNLGAQNQKTCLGNIYPMVAPPPDEHWQDYSVDLDAVDISYDSLQNIINTLTQQYNVSTGNTALLKLQEINQKRVLLKDLVGRSLLFLEDPDSSDILDWVNRANPLLGTLSTLNFYFYKGAFDEISTKLQSTNSDDADVFIESVEWLGGKYPNEIDLFHLPSADLDTLQTFAESSFGDYTNILRSFLYSEYDLYVPWPVPIIERSSGESLNTITIPEPLRFLVVPNPTSNCFTIKDYVSDKDYLTIQIHNLNGQLIEKLTSHANNTLCLSSLAKGMFVLQIKGSESAKPEMHLIVKI